MLVHFVDTFERSMRASNKAVYAPVTVFHIKIMGPVCVSPYLAVEVALGRKQTNGRTE